MINNDDHFYHNNTCKLIILFLHIYLVNCKWGDFGEWSRCSQTCGNGQKSRTRSRRTQEANGGSPCVGDETDKQSCNPEICPGR